jgi:hypothetical protein
MSGRHEQFGARRVSARTTYSIKNKETLYDDQQAF